jgi:Domain of unknown function (DUF6916)
MLETFTMQTFSEQLNTSFRFHLNDSEVMEAQLIEVKDIGMTPVQEQFSLFFQTARDRPPRQALYRVEHEKLGEFDLLLVPVRAEGKNMYYEAVFNRLREGE